MPATRIYVTTNTQTKEECLVDARSIQQARSFIAKPLIGVRVASQRDVARLVSQGVLVQEAIDGGEDTTNG